LLIRIAVGARAKVDHCDLLKPHASWLFRKWKKSICGERGYRGLYHSIEFGETKGKRRNCKNTYHFAH
jgi:hypothetical protein